MKALVYRGVRDLGCETLPDPGLREATDAVVRVELAAVCGSDLHVWHGRERGLDPGTVMGHEFVGQVVETGRAVRRLRVGHRVLSPFTTSCGDCFFCRSGLTSRCVAGQLFGWIEGGRGLDGAQAQLVRVPRADATLVPAPDGLSLETGLLLGDVLPTGHYCALRGDVGPGTSCVVVGCGPVGLAAVLAARWLGAARVFAVDAVPERLERAARLGATPLVAHEDVGARVRDETGGRGADAVLEAVGNRAAHRAALDLVRPGGTLSVVGVHTEDGFPFTPAELYDRNLTYRVGRCPARQLMEGLLPRAAAEDAVLAALFTDRLPLDQGAAAYERFDAKRDGCIKIALVP